MWFHMFTGYWGGGVIQSEQRPSFWKWLIRTSLRGRFISSAGGVLQFLIDARRRLFMEACSLPKKFPFLRRKDIRNSEFLHTSDMFRFWWTGNRRSFLITYTITLLHNVHLINLGFLRNIFMNIPPSDTLPWNKPRFMVNLRSRPLIRSWRKTKFHAPWSDTVITYRSYDTNDFTSIWCKRTISGARHRLPRRTNDSSLVILNAKLIRVYSPE